jgi:hypothetical protein
MNFLQIILQAFFNNREHLESYIFRQFKIAEKEHFFEVDEFFTGCLKVVNYWESKINEGINNEKRELYQNLTAAKNGTLTYQEGFEGKTIEQQRQESIEYYNEALANLSPDGKDSFLFSVNLSHLHQSAPPYNITLDEVLQLMFAIQQAHKKATQKNLPETKNQKEFESLICSKFSPENSINISITEKLAFWNEIIKTNVSEPLKEKYGNNTPFNIEAKKEEKVILTQLFGENYRLVTPLLIPENIYNEHFKDETNKPEFTYWFLKYHAQRCFNDEISMKHLPEKLETSLSENFIKAELRKLNDFEQQAESLLLKSKIEIYDEYLVSEHANEIEYLRIKAEYYKSHVLQDVHAGGNRTVQLYAKHIYLKEFLEDELKKLRPSQPHSHSINPLQINSIEETPTHKQIEMLLLSLATLTPDNANEVFERNFERWRYKHSNEVTINGVKIEGIEREMMLLPDKDGCPQIDNCIISDTTKGGFPLTKQTFINEELAKYEPLYNKTIGSDKDRENNLRLKTYIDYLRMELNRPHQTSEKQKPELPTKQITFKNSEIIHNLHTELKGYFPNKEAELLNALQGELLKERLLYPHNGSSFAEVFKRLKYNGFIISTPTEIKDWICNNFNFIKTQGQKKMVEDFKENSVWDVLTKTKCEPSNKNRICTPEWLPFIPQKTRQRKAKEEKL